MTIGALDKDSGALAKRLELQHRLSTFRLNDWIFQHIDKNQESAGLIWDVVVASRAYR